MNTNHIFYSLALNIIYSKNTNVSREFESNDLCLI